MCLAFPLRSPLQPSSYSLVMSPPVTFNLQLGLGSSEMPWSHASLNQEGSLGAERWNERLGSPSGSSHSTALTSDSAHGLWRVRCSGPGDWHRGAKLGTSATKGGRREGERKVEDLELQTFSPSHQTPHGVRRALLAHSTNK